MCEERNSPICLALTMTSCQARAACLICFIYQSTEVAFASNIS